MCLLHPLVMWQRGAVPRLLLAGLCCADSLLSDVRVCVHVMTIPKTGVQPGLCCSQVCTALVATQAVHTLEQL